MSERKVGDILDARGVWLDIDEEDLITDMVVIAKVLNSRGKTTVAMASTDGTDWVTKAGLARAVDAILHDGGYTDA